MAGRFSVEAIFTAVDRMSKPVARMEGRVARMSRSMAKNLGAVNAVTSKIAGGLRRVGVAAAAGGFIAGAAIKNVVDSGAAFEQAITNVGAVSLRARDEIAALEKKALELGASTKFTATEVAQGMELMAKAGFSDPAILGGIEGVLAAAAAGGIEIAETANIVSNVLKGMGLDVERDAGRVADVLAVASSKTNSSIGSIGESMKNVSAVAKQFGISFKDTVTSVALLQDVGLDASTAGSAFATMLTKMAKPSKALQRQMDEMGVSFRKSNGDMKALPVVLSEISKAAKESGGNMDTAAFFADLVGLRGQKAAISLKNLAESGKFAELSKALKDVKGKAAEMAGIRMDTFTGDMLKFGAAADAVKITLFDMEKGPLRGLIQGMTKWIDKNKEVITSGILEFIQSLVDNGPAIAKWASIIARGVGAFLAVAAAVKVASVAAAAFNFIVAANPFVLFALAVIAAVALIVAFWPEISAFFTRMWEGIKEIGGSIVGSIGDLLTAAWEPIKAFLVAAGEFYVGIWVFAIEALRPIWAPFLAFIANVAERVVDFFRPVGEFFTEMWEGLGEIGTFAIEKVSSAFKKVSAAVMGFFAPVGVFFTNLWEGIVSGFQSAIAPIMSSLKWVRDKFGAVRTAGASVLEGNDTESATAGFSAAPAAQVSSPQESIARSFSENVQTNRSELTIRDESGRAEQTGGEPLFSSGIVLESQASF